MFCRRARSLNLRLFGAALLALAGSAQLGAQELVRDPPGERDLALMGTIPIYWGEQESMAALLDDNGGGHWARGVIEPRWRLRPLDYLSAEALAGYRHLMLAQPRGLTAEENVALDAWVRSGGRLLLFADPQMTAHSRFAIGDRRRPQDVALLSPILGHWGLELRFDEGQVQGRQPRDGLPPEVLPPIPVDLPGELATPTGASDCTLLGAGLIAECRLGGGVALIVADAALLDEEVGEIDAQNALRALLLRIYGNPVLPPELPSGHPLID